MLHDLQNLSTAPTPQDEDEVIGEVEEDNEDHQGIINKGDNNYAIQYTVYKN